MNRDLVTEFDWDDPHSYTLNRLYTLYREELSGLGNLADLGYKGYADPLFVKDNAGPFTPDFLAIGPDGDAQIVDVKGFKNIDEYLDGRSAVEAKIGSVVEELGKYRDITPSMVSDYLSLWDVSYNPDHHELVVLLPNEVYEEYDTTIIEAADSVDLGVWILDENSVEHLWLAHGEHNNPLLNEQLSRSKGGRGVRVYQGGKDFIRFARDTDRDIVRFFFVANMTAHCAHEGKRTFMFEEVDDILVHERRPPMFGHLPPSEREDIWIDCIRAMRDRFGLISRLATVKDTYEWEPKRFLRQPRDRFKILQDVGEDLGVLEEVQ